MEARQREVGEIWVYDEVFYFRIDSTHVYGSTVTGNDDGIFSEVFVSRGWEDGGLPDMENFPAVRVVMEEWEE